MSEQRRRHYASDVKYNASDKGKERWKRYAQTEHGAAVRKAANARYRQTLKGQETKRENNQRRIIVGKMYLGMLGFTKREMEDMRTNGTID